MQNFKIQKKDKKKTTIMSRCSPYITKAPEGWQQRINELSTIRLFLVSTVGPTVFILKADDMTQATFKVFIGQRQMCSCGGGEARGELCFHILFVLIKVLRVPSDNPIAWQLSLIDSEIDSILSGQVGSRGNNGKKNPPRRSFMKKGHGEKLRQQKKHSMMKEREGETDNSNGSYDDDMTKSVLRKDLLEDNICCICQEDMTMEDFEGDALCFCESQCGINIHKRCFRMYASYNRSEKKPIAW
jgi:E3 ubiquitin-protein ligase ZSWIM2